MHLLLFIFLLIAGVIWLGFYIVGALLRILFGLGRTSSFQSGAANADPARERPERTASTSGSSHQSPHKIFGSDEGEYVDFEEVKEKP
ncbi:MAG: DUF4834 family protein [Mediterranea sp.]|jgi:hypothetical protein|nr:DUF4834 family protein [Mediterranea sp.]